MKFLSENHRVFETDLLVYQNAGAEVSAATLQDAKEKSDLNKFIPEAAFQPGNKEEVWKIIEARYSPGDIATGESGPYAEIISAFVDRIMPEAENKDDLIRASTERYSGVYKKEEKEFFATAGELNERFDDALDDIKEKTKNELSLLREKVEANKHVSERTKKIQEVKDPIEKLRTEYRFDRYLGAMNEKYLGKRGLRIPIVYPDLRKDKMSEEYKEMADKFMEGMEFKVAGKFDYLLSRPDTNAETMKKFQQEIEEEYKKIANLDGKPGMIDLEDLYILEKLSSPSIDILAKLNTSDEGFDLQLMEAVQLMKPKVWYKGIEKVKEDLVTDAEHNGTESQMLEAAKEWCKMNKENPPKDYDDAEDYFENTLDKYSQFSVAKTFEFIKHFDSYINRAKVDFLEAVEPKSLKTLVFYERERLLSGRLTPQNKTDAMIVKFVAGDRETRERIIRENGPALFKAVRTAQQRYPEIYDEKYQASIPEEVGELRTRSTDRERPTTHDQAARLQALIVLANEAEWIIGNLSTSEKFKTKEGEKTIAEQLGETEADEKAALGLKFKDNRKVVNTPYRSSIYRGGFNGKDLALKGVKIFAAFTVIANVGNSIRVSKGKDIFEKLANSVENTIKNPAVLGGAAAFAGAYTLERYPQYNSYLGESEYGKKRIITTAWLDKTADKVPEKNVKSFLNTNAEWAAMDKMQPEDVKELIQKADERAQKTGAHFPMITNADIAQFVSEKGILSALPETGISGHMRYLFYSRFLTSSEKPNVRELRESCDSWRA